MYLLLGYGKSNQSIEKFFIENQIKYVVYDDYKKQNNIDLSNIDVIIKSNGITNNHCILEEARFKNIKIISDLQFYFDETKEEKSCLVTGSNGKTTTTTLTYEILKTAYPENTHLAGNIGIPLSAMIKDIKPNDFLVAEISDHQLCDMYNFKTNVSIVTNIVEAHIDFHDSYDRYKAMKKRIFNHLTNEDLVIINKDNEEALHLTDGLDLNPVYFSKNSEELCYFKDSKIYYDGEEVVDTTKFLVKGNHNVENAMAAIIAVKKYNVDNETIQSVLYNFKGVEHRLEFVGNINGRLVYNDSKSTNCESTKIALKSFNQPTLLILGGLDRGHSFDDLTPCMGNVNYVACYGETKSRIKEYCDRIGVSCGVFDTLVNATNACYEKATKGDVVLLSPACASWDQYKKFEDRGDEFKNTIKGFKGE